MTAVSKGFGNGAYLTSGEVSRMFGVAVRSVQLWTNSGALPTSTTPGGHRRVHRAHVQLLLKRLKHSLPHPTAGEYDAAELMWSADPDKLTPAQVNKVAEFQVSARSEAWLLEQHNLERVARGGPVMVCDDNGNLTRMLDVSVHDAWCRGVAYALAFLTDQQAVNMPEDTATPFHFPTMPAPDGELA
jgi:MerR HTH family regulatory protein